MQKVTAIIEVQKHDGAMELVVGRELTAEQVSKLAGRLESENRRAKLLGIYAPENIRVIDGSQVK
jgi:hypothetical protein